MRKVVIVAVALVVVVPTVLALAIRLTLKPDVLKAAFERQASAWLERRVTVVSARPHLFPRAGVTLTGVAVDGVQRLTADEVEVSAGLRALLAKRIEDAVVRVRNGRVALPERAAGGTSSSQSTRGSRGSPAARERRPPAAAAAPPTAAASPGFTIASVSRIAFDNVILTGGGKQLRLDLHGSLAGDALEVGDLALSSGTTSLKGSGRISSLARRDGSFTLSSPLIDIDEVLAVLGALVPANPTATGMSALSGDEPEGLTFGHVTAQLAVERGRALGYEVSTLASSLDVKGTKLVARPLTFNLYGGRYESTLELDLATNRVALSHDASANGANVAQLVELFGNAGAATGTLGLTMQVRGAGKDFTAAARRVSGAAKVRIADGTIAGLDVVRQAFTLLGAPPTEGTQGERFESITASLGVADGTLSTDDFALHSPDFDLTGRLRIAPGGALSGDADLMLSDALSRQAQSKNKDLKLAFEDGRVTLPVAIGGTLTSPRVLPDINDALRRAARNRATAEFDKAKKKGSDELKRGLNRLLKHED